jgi:hypothetical protein
MSQLEGGCFCGAVRYRLTERPMFTNCCHCRDCQKQAGSAFAINAIIETDRIELLSGEPQPVRMPTESGRPHDIYRCTQCQSALWSDYGGRPWVRFVRVATLDDPTAITPDAHIFARSKLPWVQLPPEARVFDIYYDMKTEWSPQSLARRDAAIAAAQ